MSGRRWSWGSPWPSGSSGRSASSGSTLWPVLRLLLRVAVTYVVTCLVWIPMQPWFTWWLAAGAERLLRLIQRPPLITSVVASGNVITISSYVTGFDSPMASWNDANLHFFVVAPIALMLAVPL